MEEEALTIVLAVECRHVYKYMSMEVTYKLSHDRQLPIELTSNSAKSKQLACIERWSPCLHEDNFPISHSK